MMGRDNFMDKERRNVKKSFSRTIKDTINKNMDKNDPHSDSNYEQNGVVNETRGKFNEESNKNQNNKQYITFAIVCIVIAIASFVFGGRSTAHTAKLTQNVIKDGVDNLAPGTVLTSNDLIIETKDYTIKHKSNDKDTLIWIWDFSAEDGDYVQVFVDDVLLADTFWAVNKPRVFTVPLESKVKVKGVKDGVNGISYAIKFQINGKTYFNLVPEGQTNTYSLVKE